MPNRFLPKRSPLADNILDARIRHIEDWLGKLGASGVNPNVTTNAGSFGSNSAASAGQVVTASGGGSSGGGSGPALALAGDVTGPVRTNLVSNLQGNLLTLSTPAPGQLITWDGTQFLNQNWVAGSFGVGGSPVDGTWEVFTTHLAVYVTDTSSPQSGSRGLHLNKLARADSASHAVMYEVGGVPLWGHGMDYDTAGTGRADYIPVFDNSANAGAGADVFRWSGEADAPGGTSQTCKFTAGRTAGSPRTFDSFGFFNGGDNTTGLGGLSIGFFDESATFNALKLLNRSATKKRTPIWFNGQYLLGPDLGNTGAQNFALHDLSLAADVWSVDSAGTITHPLKTTCNGVVTINITNDNGLVLKNTGIGGLYLEQETTGLKRTAINMNNLFQWGTDLAFNGTQDFWMQNLATGNAWLYCDVNDRVTLGSTNALGGAVLGVSGGKAGFYGAAPVAKQTLTGDWLGSAALKNVAAALGALGAVVDSTTANDPTVPSWSWINQGGATTTAASGTLYLNAPAGSGDNLRLQVLAVPGGNYTITLGFIPNLQWANFMLCGLCLYNSTSGSIVTHALTSNNSLDANGQVISVAKWTNGTTFSANYTTTPATVKAPVWQAGQVMWLRIQDDGTNRISSVSNDGANWTVIHTVGRTDFITPTHFGFFVDANNASFAGGINVVYWKQS